MSNHFASFASSLRALGGLFVFVLLLALVPTATAATKPNIIFILADDLGWRDLGCTGSTFYETPNLDRLAAQGTRFTRVYAACPVCSPTRAAIMTGCYTPRTGITDYLGGHAVGRVVPAPFADHLNPDLTTIPQALKPAGYVAWHVGKWHLGNKEFLPVNYGFDAEVIPRGNTYFPPYKAPALSDGPKGEYLTDRLTDEALKLLRSRDPNKPFFLNLWYTAPHVPLQAPQALVDKYKQKAQQLKLDGPETVEGEPFPSIDKAGRNLVRRRVQSHPVYAAMIESMDTNIGRILQFLEEQHLIENTLIIFTSDNGGLSTAEGSPTTNSPLKEGKGWLYEGGTRVAMLARWPAVIPPSSTCDTPVISTDYLPTFCQIAAASTPANVDGVSLLPLLKDPASKPIDRPLFWHYPHYGNQGGTPGSSVLTGDLKLIERYDGTPSELYNLKDDPSETNNISKDHPKEVARLRAKLDAWRNDVGARLPTPNAHYPKKPPAPTSARPGNE